MDDYLHITLTDEQDIPEALARLRVIYPNLMRLDYDNRRTQTRQAAGCPCKGRTENTAGTLCRFLPAAEQPAPDP